MASSKNNTLEFSSAGSTVLGTGHVKSGRIGAVQVVLDTTFGVLAADNVDESLQPLYWNINPSGNRPVR